jgi:glycosyltransferase involved in cell wall biosynthesis
MKFSLIYPTRDRPNFVEVALRFLECQNFDDFEIIVCDNCSDVKYSCEKICATSSLKNLKYIRAPINLNMTENWNYALSFSSGEYIAFFTDKTFVLPDLLFKVSELLNLCDWDIINWTGNFYAPINENDNFGKGNYVKINIDNSNKNYYTIFNPQDELNKKGDSIISRTEQSHSEYCRGKICFGCYSRRLITKIISRTGELFEGISPDYTSMIKALFYAKHSVELNTQGVVQLSTSLSNGFLTSISDLAALNFIKTLKNHENVLDNLLVPHVYASQHNIVAYDYINLKNKYNLNFRFKIENWLVYIWEDLNKNNMNWDNIHSKEYQFKLYKSFLIKRLNYEQRINLFLFFAKRYLIILYFKIKSFCKDLILKYFGFFFFLKIRKLLKTKQNFDNSITKNSILELIND